LIDVESTSLISFFDTATLPTEEMFDAMRVAPLGDDGYGRDPTVNRLERLAAEEMGMEAAVLMPSGTMSNLAAVLVHTRPGDEVITEESSHIICAELAGLAAVAGCMPRTVRGERGVLSAAAVEPHLRAHSQAGPPITLLCVENTHNRGGGTVTPPAVMGDLRALCDRHGLSLHVDGARIFNAAVALDVPTTRLTAGADSVCFSLSKGLGAPAGSLLCGTGEFIAQARRMRRMLGGGMRQSGVLAAAGLVAMRDGRARLEQDHLAAQRLAQRLRDVRGLDVDPSTVETNIVMCRIDVAGLSSDRLSERLLERGIVCSAPHPAVVRFVVHHQIGAREQDQLLASLAAVLQEEAQWS
jgi:threonine aldolase